MCLLNYAIGLVRPRLTPIYSARGHVLVGIQCITSSFFVLHWVFALSRELVFMADFDYLRALPSIIALLDAGKNSRC